MPNSLEKKTICAKTGKLASSDLCSKYTEYFAPGTAPTQSCNGHVGEATTTTPTTEGTTQEGGTGTSENSSSNGTTTQ